ncbi:MAG TPA: hypothetical protein VKG23_07345 [Thermoanaerobaculia bacterium]|nr:hypothetical protein [Thermoanaerobaculia bacterium]
MRSLVARRLGLAALVFTAAIPLLSQAGEDRPELVSSSQWIKLGDRAGIVVTSSPSRAGGKPSGDAKGELWIKLDGRWVSATLEQSHQFLPAR